MYDVDWNNVIRGVCPPRLYKKTIVAWLSVIIGQIQYLHSLFLSYANKVSYQLSHSSQVCYLEGALNDSFDPSQRRIYIKDAGGSVIVPLQRDTDLEPVLLNSDSTDEALILQGDSGYTGGEYDFIVVIPYQYTDAEIYRMRSLIDFYKLAGKRYDIIVG